MDFLIETFRPFVRLTLIKDMSYADLNFNLVQTAEYALLLEYFFIQ